MMLSSALVLIVALLGSGSAQQAAQTCDLNITSVIYGVAGCSINTYERLVADPTLRTTACAMAVEYGLPRAACDPFVYHAAAGHLVEPQLGLLGLGLIGGFQSAVNNASLEATLAQLWAKVKMLHDGHCSYVAPQFRQCVATNVSQTRRCGNATSYINDFIDTAIGMTCNQTTMLLSDSAAASLYQELEAIVVGVRSMVSDGVAAGKVVGDLKHLVGLIITNSLNENTLVDLLMSSARNGTLSLLPLSSWPYIDGMLISYVNGAVDTVAQALGFATNDPLIAAFKWAVGGFNARFANVSTPVQLVNATLNLVDQLTSLAPGIFYLSPDDGVQMLSQTLLGGFGPNAFSNVTAVNIMAQRLMNAIRSALSNLTAPPTTSTVTRSATTTVRANATTIRSASSTTTVRTTPAATTIGYAYASQPYDYQSQPDILTYIFFGAAGDDGSTGYMFGPLQRFFRVVVAINSAVGAQARAGNLLAAELAQVLNTTLDNIVVFGPGGNVATQANASQVAATNAMNLLIGTIAQMGALGNCTTVSSTDQLLRCIAFNDAASRNRSAAEAIADITSDLLVYAALTGFQNVSRVIADVSRITRLNGYLNRTLLIAGNLSALSAQLEQVLILLGRIAYTAVAQPAWCPWQCDGWTYINAKFPAIGALWQQSVASFSTGLRQLAANGSHVAADIGAALASSFELQMALAVVGNAAKQAGEGAQAVLTVINATTLYVNTQRVVPVSTFSDPLKIVAFVCAPTTPAGLLQATRNSLLRLVRANNSIAVLVLNATYSQEFLMVWSYVLNGTKLACDEYAYGQALYTNLTVALKPYAVEFDPMGVVNFLLNQSAWDALVAVWKRTTLRLASTTRNQGAAYAIEVFSDPYFNYMYQGFDNVTRLARSAIRRINETCVRPDVLDILMSRVFSDNYAVTRLSMSNMFCEMSAIGRCAIRSVNSVTGGSMVPVMQEVTTALSMVTQYTQLPFSELMDLQGWNAPVNNLAVGAPVAIVASYYGGWTRSLESPTIATKCKYVSDYDVLLTNSYYTLIRAAFPNGTEQLSLTFYGRVVRTGAQVVMATYVTRADPSRPQTTAAVRLFNAAGRLAVAAEGNGVSVALTVNTAGVVTITDSSSRAVFRFHVTNGNRLVVAVRATAATLSTSMGTLICGCLSTDTLASLPVRPLASCFAPCAGSATRPAACTARVCTAVSAYRATGLDSVADILASLVPRKH